jgi:hemerythrin
MVKRRNLNMSIPQSVWDFLDAHVAETDSTYTETVKNSLKLLEWVKTVRKNEEAILVRDKDGNVREISILF